MGFLYCRQSWAERMTPVYLARFGVDLGATHEAARGGDDFRLMPDARRFDLGNFNFAAAAGRRCCRWRFSTASAPTRSRRTWRGLRAALPAASTSWAFRVAGGGAGAHLGRHRLDRPARRRRPRQQRRSAHAKARRGTSSAPGCGFPCARAWCGSRSISTMVMPTSITFSRWRGASRHGGTLSGARTVPARRGRCHHDRSCSRRRRRSLALRARHG